MSQRRSAHSRRQASVDHPRHPPQSSLQAQAPQPQYPYQPSDYESDYPTYLSDIPPRRPHETRTNDELNLDVLRRHKSDIASILSIAPYAVIYEFTPHPEPAWTKSGIEGSLFICQLTPGPLGQDRYIAIVLNRRGLDNFETELREGDNSGIEVTEEYVIVSLEEAGMQKIYGIFIFSEGPGSSTEKTRDLNGQLMKQCAVQAGLSLKAAEAAAAEALPPQNNGHLDREDSIDEATFGVPMGRQISLQELFGRQRAEDASWSVRVHSPEGRGPGLPYPTAGPSMLTQLGPQPAFAREQQDVLGDLFRRAGLGYQS